MSQAKDATEAAVVYASIGVAAAVTGVTLQLAAPLNRLLGKTGIHVLTRVFGLLLAAVAVQFVLNALASVGVIRAPAE
jgi:multiple antibiotic resistance protein